MTQLNCKSIFVSTNPEIKEFNGWYLKQNTLLYNKSWWLQSDKKSDKKSIESVLNNMIWTLNRPGQKLFILGHNSDLHPLLSANWTLQPTQSNKIHVNLKCSNTVPPTSTPTSAPTNINQQMFNINNRVQGIFN